MRWAILPYLVGRNRRAKERRANYRKLQRGLLLESLEQRQLLTFAITNYALYNDTGTPSDNISADPRVTGTVSGGATSGPWTVAFDLNNDGTPDGTTTSDAMGVFIFDPGNITPGSITIKARAEEVVSSVTVYTSWNTLTYTFDPPPNDPPEIENLELVNDDGESSTDGITSDPRIQGVLVNPDGPAAFIQIEFDHDGDNIVDGTARSGTDGSFTYIPRNLDAGEVEIRVRGVEVEPRTSDELFGDWFPIEFTYDPQPRGPEIEFTLKNDNLDEPDDLITSDPTLIGQVLDVSGLGIPMVEFDFNGDETPDTSILTDHSGQFTYKPTSLTVGAVTVYARGADWDPEFSEYVYGPWTEFEFTLAAASPPEVTNLRLKRDTGESDSDNITRDATILGDVITDDGPKQGVIIQFDHDEDNVIDGQTTTVTGGGFTYLPQDLEEGEYTFRARSATPIEGTENFTYGDWEEFTFTYEVNDPAVIAELKLLRDDGESSTDLITRDPRLIGEITNDGSLDRLTIEFDHNNDQTPDGYAYTTADGEFIYNPFNLQPGVITVKARAVEWDDFTASTIEGEWFTFSFTLVEDPEEQPQPPPADNAYGSASTGASAGVNEGLAAAAGALGFSGSPLGALVLPFATLVGLSEDLRSVLPAASTGSLTSASYSGTIPLSDSGDSENGDFEIEGSAVISWTLTVTGSTFTADLSITTTYEYVDSGIVTVEGQARTYTLEVDGVHVLGFTASGSFSNSGGVTTHTISSYTFSEDHDALSIYSEAASLMEGWTGGYIFTSEIDEDMEYDETGSFTNTGAAYTQSGSSTLVSGYLADSSYVETGIKTVNGVTVDYDLDAVMTATLDRSRPISSFSATESSQSGSGTFVTAEDHTATWNVLSTTTLSRGGSGNGLIDSYTGEIVTDSSYTETTASDDDGTISVSGAVWTIVGDTIYSIDGSGAYTTLGAGAYSYDGFGSTREGTWTLDEEGANVYTEDGTGSYTVVDEVVTVAAGAFTSLSDVELSITYAEEGSFSSTMGSESSSGTYDSTTISSIEIDEALVGEYDTVDDVTTSEVDYDSAYKEMTDIDSTVTIDYTTEDVAGTQTTVVSLWYAIDTDDVGTVTVVDDGEDATSEAAGVAETGVNSITSVDITGSGTISTDEVEAEFTYTASSDSTSQFDETSTYTEALDVEGTITFSAAGPYTVVATEISASTYHEEGTITLGDGYGEGPGGGEEGGGGEPGGPGEPPGGGEGGEGGGSEGNLNGEFHLTATYTLDVTSEGSLTYNDAGTFTEEGVFYLETTEDNTYTSTRAGASTTALLAESASIYAEEGSFYKGDETTLIDATYTLASTSTSNLDFDDATDYEETIALEDEEFTLHSEATSDSTTLLAANSSTTYAELGSLADEEASKAATYTFTSSASTDLDLDDATVVTVTIDATMPAEGEAEVEVDIFIATGATTLTIAMVSATDYEEIGTYSKDDVSGAYTLITSGDTTFNLSDISTTLDDEITGTTTLDLVTTSVLDYTDDGVDNSDEDSTLDFLITVDSTTTLTVDEVTTYVVNDDEADITINSTITLDGLTTTVFTGSGSFESGDTSGTFEIDSTNSSDVLMTDESTVTISTYTDVEEGKLTVVNLVGEMNLLVLINATSSHSSEFVVELEESGGGGGAPPPGGGGPTNGSEGTSSTSTTIDFTITSLENYTGIATTYHNEIDDAEDDEFESTIVTEGNALTVGEINSTVTYHQEGGTLDENTSGSVTTTESMIFETDLVGITDIDITATDVWDSEWTLTRDEKTLGYAQINSDSETILDYNATFEFGMNTDFDTAGPGTTDSSTLDTQVTVISISQVDSTHTTDDFHKVEKELIEGEVVTTSTNDVTGFFSTDATLTSTTNTDVAGTYHTAGAPTSGPGPTTDVTFENDLTFDDNRTSTTLTEASQSGSYGDGEEDSSSTDYSVISTDEYFSQYEGSYSWESNGVSMYGTFESQREGSSERVFADSKSFAPSGNSASWYTSFESENSWEVHAENTEFGYTTIFDDSGSDSHSESSGAQSYTPGEEENPTGDYRPPFETHGGSGSGEGGEGGDTSEDENSTNDSFSQSGIIWLVATRILPNGAVRRFLFVFLADGGIFAFDANKMSSFDKKLLKKIMEIEDAIKADWTGKDGKMKIPEKYSGDPGAFGKELSERLSQYFKDKPRDLGGYTNTNLVLTRASDGRILVTSAQKGSDAFVEFDILISKKHLKAGDVVDPNDLLFYELKTTKYGAISQEQLERLAQVFGVKAEDVESLPHFKRITSKYRLNAAGDIVDNHPRIDIPNGWKKLKNLAQYFGVFLLAMEARNYFGSNAMAADFEELHTTATRAGNDSNRTKDEQFLNSLDAIDTFFAIFTKLSPDQADGVIAGLRMEAYRRLILEYGGQAPVLSDESTPTSSGNYVPRTESADEMQAIIRERITRYYRERHDADGRSRNVPNWRPSRGLYW
jgi:hypothetical protein